MPAALIIPLYGFCTAILQIDFTKQKLIIVSALGMNGIPVLEPVLYSF